MVISFISGPRTMENRHNATLGIYGTWPCKTTRSSPSPMIRHMSGQSPISTGEIRALGDERQSLSSFALSTTSLYSATILTGQSNSYEGGSRIVTVTQQAVVEKCLKGGFLYATCNHWCDRR